MIKPNIGFIGAGNMAEALIKGLTEKKISHPDKIVCTDINSERLKVIQKNYQVQVAENNKSLLNTADVLVLAVKPQQAQAVFDEIKDELDPDKHCLVSIAAGLTTRYIESALGRPIKVIRVMPNTPARILEGAAAYCLGQYATDTEAMIVQLMFDAIGIVMLVDESHMDAVTAVSGSGPAYVFKLCEMMINSGLELGLEQSVAEQLTIQTIFGAAHLLKENGAKASELRKAVTSPGGTTEAALNSMNDFGIDKIFKRALTAARDRGRALSPAIKD